MRVFDDHVLEVGDVLFEGVQFGSVEDAVEVRERAKVDHLLDLGLLDFRELLHAVEDHA